MPWFAVEIILARSEASTYCITAKKDTGIQALNQLRSFYANVESGHDLPAVAEKLGKGNIE